MIFKTFSYFCAFNNQRNSTMKKVILFCIATAMVTFGSVQAQRDYRKGYIITNRQDTIYGWIDYRGEIRNSKLCSFKKTEPEQATEYSPSDIFAYRFIDSKFYVSKNVGTAYAPKMVFLEYLVSGLASLYFYRDENTNEHYYIEKDNRIVKITSEEREVRVADGVNLKTTISHVAVLKKLFDVQEMRDEIEKSKLEHSSLINIAKNYHKYACTDGSECIVYEKKKSPLIVRIAPVAGIDMSSFKLIIRNKRDYEPELSSNFFCGINLNMSIPSWFTDNFSVQMQVLYTKYYFFEVIKTSTQSTDVHIRSNVLQFGLGIKYEYPKGKWRPTLMTGIASIYLPDGSIKENIDRYSIYNDVRPSTQTYDFLIKNVWGVQIAPGIHYYISKKHIFFTQLQYIHCSKQIVLVNQLDKLNSFGLLTGIYF